MIVYDNYSFNTSREIDSNGYLRVSMSNISKTQVRPYLGREIPNYKDFELDPNKIYNVLCPEDELRKAAKTFNNLPLTREHIVVDVDDVPKEKIVGSLGDSAKVEDGYLKNNLIIYDKKDIDKVLSGARKELSCGYRYTPVRESGEYEGQHYDFKMTDIIGNHVALVKQGRAGRDVMVADSSKGLLETIKEKIMAVFDSDIVGDAEEKKEDEVEWITVRGNHIPVMKGQSKTDAIGGFFKKIKESNTKQYNESIEREKSFVKGAVESNEKGDKEKTEYYKKMAESERNMQNEIAERSIKALKEEEESIKESSKEKYIDTRELDEGGKSMGNAVSSLWQENKGKSWQEVYKDVFESMPIEKMQHIKSESDIKNLLKSKYYSPNDPEVKIAIKKYRETVVGDSEIPEKQDEPKKAGEESALQQGEKKMAEEVKEEVKTEKKVETPAKDKPVEDACSKDAEIKKEESKKEVVEDKQEKDLKGKEKEAFAEGVDYGEKKEKEEPKKLDSEHESEGTKKADEEEKEKKEEKKEEMAKDEALVMDADALRAEGRAEAMEDFKARDVARKSVRSIVGDVDIFAFDSADDIYKFACKEAGMNLDEIVSFKDAFAGLQAGKSKLALDASPVSGSNEECFKNIRLA